MDLDRDIIDEERLCIRRLKRAKLCAGWLCKAITEHDEVQCKRNSDRSAFQAMATKCRISPVKQLLQFLLWYVDILLAYEEGFCTLKITDAVAIKRREVKQSYSINLMR